jgi:hypothetical protein
MSDYSFLKSGFSGLIENDSDKDSDEFILRVQSILFSFMENGIKQAEDYVKHAGRNSITKEDIKLCLKAETFDYLQRPDILDSVQKWRNIILEDEDADFSADEDDVEGLVCEPEPEPEPEPEGDGEQEFTKSVCKCGVCDKLNNIDTVWNAWTPQEGLEIILHNAINTQF